MSRGYQVFKYYKSHMNFRNVSNANLLRRIRDRVGDKADVYAERPELRTAACLIRYFSNDFENIVKELFRKVPLSHMSNDYDVSIPLFYVSIEDSSVKLNVFTNLPVRIKTVSDTIGNFKYTHYYNKVKPLWSLKKEIVNDLEDENRKKKWEPSSRAIKRVKQVKQMTVAKYLTNYLPLERNGWSSSNIRDLAQEIAEIYVPPELHYPETALDWMHMFQDGPHSCMHSSSRHNNWQDWYKNNKNTDNPFHPALWYMYHPQIEGVYTERNGKVTARSLLFIDEDGSKFYSHIYKASPKDKEKLVRAVEDMGYKYIKYETYWQPTKDFKIPGIRVDGRDDPVCPIPYTDRIENMYHCSYSRISGKFKFEHIKNGDTSRRNWSHTSTKGWVGPENLEVVECAHPRCTVQSKVANMITAKDGKYFCGHDHANICGYKFVLEGPTENILQIPPETTITDAREPTVRYTTEKVARQCGALPYIGYYSYTNNEFSEDSPEFTQFYDCRVMWQGELYGIEYAAIDILADKRWIKTIHDNPKTDKEIIQMYDPGMFRKLVVVHKVDKLVIDSETRKIQNAG